MEGYPQHGDQYVNKKNIRSYAVYSNRRRFCRVGTKRRRWRGSRYWRRGYNWGRNDRRRNDRRRNDRRRNDRRRNAQRRNARRRNAQRRNARRRNAQRRNARRRNARAALIHSQSHRP
jgi:hypothetical protein